MDTVALYPACILVLIIVYTVVSVGGTFDIGDGVMGNALVVGLIEQVAKALLKEFK